MCGFIAQLVEHRIGIEEVVTGSNPVEALWWFTVMMRMIIFHFHFNLIKVQFNLTNQNYTTNKLPFLRSGW